MDLREKLIELIQKAKYVCANDYSDHTEDEYIADMLLDNGLTVQELDSEKIIRCKDCVYYRPAEDWDGNKYDACYLNPDICIFQRKPTDFCSYAEQKLPEPPKGE